MFQKIQEYAKFIVVLLGVVVSTGTSLIPAEWAPYLTLAVGLLTAVSVYAVPNKPQDDSGV